ncbi:hypothetical protein EKO04_003969 [Ascochyta lentis]|uniref:Uncharacterized protein n=1 Tax=Ascochyta lentis TaxID=205686 RepID=A0A8H7J8X6_9PLEO|nr:hypothetical protein EKO04_003969 [Ascochyta lentis]
MSQHATLVIPYPIKVLEFLSCENPGSFVRGDGAPGNGEDWGLQERNDSAVELPAHFLVWLSQPKTRCLNGKMIWANWDVDELEAKAGDIQGRSIMMIEYGGCPFGPGL